MKNTQDFLPIIQGWIKDYQALHDILNSEQIALEKRDFDRLREIIQEKDLQVNIINQHGAQQLPLAKLKQLCEQDPLLSPCWSELMGLVEKCALKNEVNARLIELVNQSSKRTFNLIKGVDPDNNIYNATGSRSTLRHYGQSISA